MHRQDILMLQVAAYLDFSQKLALLIIVDQLLLVKNFQGDDILRLLLSGEVYMAELTSTKWLTNFEIVYAPRIHIELAVRVFL